MQTGVPFMTWLSPEVRIYAGSTQSLYLHCNSGLLYKTGDTEGAQSTSGDGLVINQGTATSGFFSGAGGIAKFTGGIGYVVFCLIL